MITSIRSGRLLPVHVTSVKLAGLFVAALFSLTIQPDTAQADTAKIPTIDLPSVSPVDNVERTPRPDERLGEYLNRVSVHGPANLLLVDQAAFDLPKNFNIMPDDTASVLLNQIDGTPYSANVLGLIFPVEKEIGYILVEYYPTGHVSEEGFKTIDPAAALAKLKGHSDAKNAEAKKNAGTEVEIVGWKQKPAYNAKTNRVSYILTSKENPAPNADDPDITYVTGILGREGIYMFSLVTDQQSFEKRKPEIDGMLASFHFIGKSAYLDFDPKSDAIGDCSFVKLVGNECEQKTKADPVAKMSLPVK